VGIYSVLKTKYPTADIGVYAAGYFI